MANDGEDSAHGWVDDSLSEICRKKWWWPLGIFLLVTTPGLFNAMHITVYVFITDTPKHICRIPELEAANWTFEQMQEISTPSLDGKGCNMYAWDYEELANLGYNASLSYIKSLDKPALLPCAGYVYDSQINSVVTEWDLICDRSQYKSAVQASASLGKFIGAFFLGFVADRFGRKTCFTLAALVYIISGPLAAMVNSFTMFQIMRLLIGIAGSGVYETGYTLLSELIGTTWRTRLGCIFAIFYPVGMVVLSVVGYYFDCDWRKVQLWISLPLLLLLINCWLLPESPRWLLIHGKEEKAKKILGVSSHSVELQDETARKMVERPMDEAEIKMRAKKSEHAWYKKVIAFIKESSKIVTVSELRSRALICYFSWFVASLGYYAIALNANNLSGNRYLYVAMNGLVEAPGYLFPILVLMYIGRKAASILAFLGSGVALLSILLLPKDATASVTVAAMIGRFFISSIFSVISLHTSELFPTSNRNTAFGLSLTMSQIGSIGAPYVVDIIGNYAWYGPSTLCGILSVLAAAAVLLLPETRNRPLADTVNELTSYSRPVSLLNCCSCR